MWEVGYQDPNEAREKKLSDKFFKPALEKGAQMIRHHNNIESAHDIVRTVMKNHPAALRIQRELVDESKAIIDTAAGGALNNELQEQAERLKAELDAVRAEMEYALKEKDEQLRQGMEDAKTILEEKIEKIEDATKRMEATMEEMEQEAEHEMERTKQEQGMEWAKREREMKRLRDRNKIPIYE